LGLVFAIPLWVVISTSLKSLDEIRDFSIFVPPSSPHFAAWWKAWYAACTGLNCSGVHVGFWNSVRILIPSVTLSVLAGALNGYALSHWRVPGADLILLALLLGAFIPYQVTLYPLVKIISTIGIYSSLPGIIAVHPSRNQKQLRFEPEKPFDGVQHAPVVVWQSCRDCTQFCTSCQTFAPPTKAQTCAVLMLQRRS
jgi:ABC-type glycerol-3-phosphate transport system permease component